jgi:hypothetical protein
MGGSLGESGPGAKQTALPSTERANPCSAGSRQVAEPRLELRPRGPLVLRLRIDIRKTELFEDSRVELRLQPTAITLRRASGRIILKALLANFS